MSAGARQRQVTAGALLVAAVVASMLTGCATPTTSSAVQGSPAPSPSSVATASPTPDGQALVSPAIAILADPRLEMRSVVSGRVNLDPAIGWRVSGTFDVDGDDFHFELDSTGVGPGIADTGTTKVGAAVFTRRTKGVWHAAEPSAARETLRTVLADLAGGTIDGRVTVGGRDLHRVLLVDKTLPYGLLGFESIGSSDMSLVALVDDVGRPMELRVEGGRPDVAVVDLTFVVTNIGNPITIDAPEPWSTYQSKAGGFAIDHPDGWTVAKRERGGVRFTAPDGALCDVSISEKAGWTLESWGSGGVHNVEDEIGEKVASVDRWSNPNGSLAGWLSTWRIRSGDWAGYYLYAAFVDGRGYGYDVHWFSHGTNRITDRAMLESYLRTFDLVN